jgi:hypothetical protein
MNNQDILNEIEELKERLDSLKKLYDSLIPLNKRWRADRENTYYFINSDGRVFFENDYTLRVDDMRYAFGNYFKTMEEAKFEAERLKVVAELKEWATPANHFDWNDMYVQKYFISLEFGKIVINSFSTYQNSDLVFASKEAAKKAIEAVGEDKIIKYYFKRGEKSAYIF